jgi:membrane protease YdiL (CAAX protease family)
LEKSTGAYLILVIVLSICAWVGVFLPQGNLTPSEFPASKLVLATANSLLMLLVYGSLGFLGLKLSRRIGFSDIWDRNVSNKQRFLVPLLIGVFLGMMLIILDLLLSPFNSVGRLPHPPLPYSLIASLSAGIGEEIIFRLFFISLFVWIVSTVLLKKKAQDSVFWTASVIAALLFSVGHLPSLMILLGIKSMADFSVVLIAEVVGLNSVISLFAAYYFRKYGFLAPVGIHFWADMVWHVVYGGLLVVI